MEWENTSAKLKHEEKLILNDFKAKKTFSLFSADFRVDFVFNNQSSWFDWNLISVPYFFIRISLSWSRNTRKMIMIAFWYFFLGILSKITGFYWALHKHYHQKVQICAILLCKKRQKRRFIVISGQMLTKHVHLELEML